ncbi:MAG TPA: hypothetical protein QGF58_09105 [Myxococcota bacterium]|nr:hypothetical protein [Myxococcota bacterium]
MLFLLACAPSAELQTLEASSFGHETIEILVEPDVEVLGVTVGGLNTYDLQRSDDRLTVTVQGIGEAGPATVLVLTPEAEVDAGELDYFPAADPLFDRVVGIGASLTQGVQDGVPTFHANLMSPGAQMARQAGANYGIPLLVEDLFPTIEIEHIGPAPECESPPVVAHVTNAALEVLNKLNDDEGNFRYDFGRVDPDLPVYDAAVGGFMVGHLTEGLYNDFTRGFLAHMVLDPYAELNEGITFSQVDLVLERDPTLVLCFDTFGNDLIGAIVLGKSVDLGAITPEDEFIEDVELLFEELGASDAEVFVANSPRPGLLPAARNQVLRADDPEAEQAKIDEADEIALRYNALFSGLAEGYPNIHVVDAYSHTERLSEDGLVANGETLDARMFGGLLSLDGVHFTDTGYAEFANLFLDAIEDDLGVDMERVDIDAVAAADLRTPSALRDAGLDVDACDR